MYCAEGILHFTCPRSIANSKQTLLREIIRHFDNENCMFPENIALFQMIRHLWIDIPRFLQEPCTCGRNVRWQNEHDFFIFWKKTALHQLYIRYRLQYAFFRVIYQTCWGYLSFFWVIYQTMWVLFIKLVGVTCQTFWGYLLVGVIYHFLGVSYQTFWGYLLVGVIYIFWGVSYQAFCVLFIKLLGNYLSNLLGLLIFF